MVVSKKIIHKYRNLRIINKSSFSKQELNSLIKVALPKKLKNKKVVIFVLNWKSYKKEIKELNLLSTYKKAYRLYPFSGLSFFIKEKLENYWVRRPMVIVLVPKHNNRVRFTGDKKKGYLSIVTKNKEELFISILSHELKHIVCNSRGINPILEETVCDRYAISRVKTYRKMEIK